MHFIRKKYLLLVFTINYVCGSDIAVFINPKKVVNVIDDRFISVIADSELLISGLNFSLDSSLDIVKQLSPAFIRIQSLSANHLSVTDDADDLVKPNLTPDNKVAATNDGFKLTLSPAKWIQMTKWFINANLTPIFSLSDRDRFNDAWNPKSVALPLMVLADKSNISCFWEISNEKDNKTLEQYADDVTRLHNVLEAFPSHYNSWRVAGGELSHCTLSEIAPETADDIRKLLARITSTVDAIYWTPKINDVKPFPAKIKRFMSMNKIPTIWTIASSDANEINFDNALIWAKLLGQAAQNGYKAIFKQLSLKEMLHPSPNFWVSYFHKKLMGNTILDIQLINYNPIKNCYIFAHTTKNKKNLATLFVVNFDNENITLTSKFVGQRLSSNYVKEFILTSSSKNSSDIHLNNRPLSINDLNIDDTKFDTMYSYRRRRLFSNKSLKLLVPSKSVGFFIIPYVNPNLESKPQPWLVENIGLTKAESLDSFQRKLENDFDNKYSYENLQERFKQLSKEIKESKTVEDKSTTTETREKRSLTNFETPNVEIIQVEEINPKEDLKIEEIECPCVKEGRPCTCGSNHNSNTIIQVVQDNESNNDDENDANAKSAGTDKKIVSLFRLGNPQEWFDIGSKLQLNEIQDIQEMLNDIASLKNAAFPINSEKTVKNKTDNASNTKSSNIKLKGILKNRSYYSSGSVENSKSFKGSSKIDTMNEQKLKLIKEREYHQKAIDNTINNCIQKIQNRASRLRLKVENIIKSIDSQENLKTTHYIFKKNYATDSSCDSDQNDENRTKKFNKIRKRQISSEEATNENSYMNEILDDDYVMSKNSIKKHSNTLKKNKSYENKISNDILKNGNSQNQRKSRSMTENSKLRITKSKNNKNVLSNNISKEGKHLSDYDKFKEEDVYKIKPKGINPDKNSYSSQDEYQKREKLLQENINKIKWIRSDVGKLESDSTVTVTEGSNDDLLKESKSDLSIELEDSSNSDASSEVSSILQFEEKIYTTTIPKTKADLNAPSEEKLNKKIINAPKEDDEDLEFLDAEDTNETKQNGLINQVFDSVFEFLNDFQKKIIDCMHYLTA